MPFLDSVFAWVVTASVRASLLAVVVFALRRVVGHRLSARCRHALWLPVIFVLVAPTLPTSPWNAAQRFAGPLEVLSLSVVPLMLARCPWLPLGWLLATSALIVVAGASYHLTLARIRRGDTMADPGLLSDILAEARRIRLRRLPCVMVSEAVASPAVTGLFRPVLLLPKAFPAGLTRTESALILLHELTHLRRFDVLFNWALCVLQALHWFNPLLWLAFGRLRTDREAACDAQVLSTHEEDLRAEYAHALLKLHQAAPVPGFSLAFGGILAPATLRGRLLSIARHRRIHPAWSVAGAGMVAGLVLVGATRSPSHEEIASGAPADVHVKTGLVLLIERAGGNIFSNQRTGQPDGTGESPKEPSDGPTHWKSHPDFGGALPEWWPTANSVRFLFHSASPTKQPTRWGSDRQFA